MISNFLVKDNVLIADNTYKMKIYGNTKEIKKPGQFINIRIGEGLDFFLRRPISICEYDKEFITIIYKVLGKGTKALSNIKVGEYLDIMAPLGNGYTIKDFSNQILIGGGIGIPPLYGLAKEMKNKGLNFDVVLGFNSHGDIFYEKEFLELANNVYIATMDGSYGYKGNVLDLIKEKNLQFDYYYSCGPERMLEALIKEGYNGQLSFEERMGCGFGACMGCSKKTIQGYKRICKEGPVLESWEVYLNE